MLPVSSRALALTIWCAALLASSSSRSTAFAQDLSVETTLLASQIDLLDLVMSGSVIIGGVGWDGMAEEIAYGKRKGGSEQARLCAQTRW